MKKITDIENRIVQLKYEERDLLRERDVQRVRSLEKAEKSSEVRRLADDFFSAMMNVPAGDVKIYAAASDFSGRSNDEHISEVKVTLSADTGRETGDILLTVYYKHGFQDPDVEKSESELMDRLLEIREEVEKLTSEKRALRTIPRLGSF